MFVVPAAVTVKEAVAPSHTAVEIGCGKMVIVFGTVIVKAESLIAVPPEVITEIFPDVPVPTTAVIVVADTTVNDVAAIPPKVTPVAPVKFVPVTVTEVPAGPLAGVKLEIVGSAAAGVIVKAELLVAVPAGVITEIFPDVPVPTTAVIVVADTTVNNVAAVPPNVTPVAPVKFVPVTVTAVPAGPLAGVKLEIVGGRAAVTENIPVVTCVHSPPLSLART